MKKTAPKSKKHGGARMGAGAKAKLPGEATVPKTFRVKEKHLPGAWAEIQALVDQINSRP